MATCQRWSIVSWRYLQGYKKFSFPESEPVIDNDIFSLTAGYPFRTCKYRIRPWISHPRLPPREPILGCGNDRRPWRWDYCPPRSWPTEGSVLYWTRDSWHRKNHSPDEMLNWASLSDKTESCDLSCRRADHPRLRKRFGWNKKINTYLEPKQWGKWNFNRAKMIPNASCDQRTIAFCLFVNHKELMQYSL